MAACVALLLLSACSGCVALVKQRHNIVSATESVIGIDISQKADGNLPHIRLGYVRSQFHVVPTVRETNQYIFTPDVRSDIGIHTGKGTNSLTEEFATGKAALTQ